MTQPAAPRKSSFLNLKGIIVLVVLLAVADLATAYLLSPLAGGIAQTTVNQFTEAKVVIGTIRVHPLLLSAGAASLDVYDPEDSSKRIFHGGPVKARLDPWALLKKRIAFAEIAIDSVQLEVVRDADGELNVEKIGKGAKEQKGALETLKAMADKRDWFRKIYDGAKKALKRKAAKKEEKAVWKTRARELPRGFVVDFETEPRPILEVGSFELKRATVVFTDPSGVMPPFRDVEIIAKSLKVQTPADVRWKVLKIAGDFDASKKGSFKLRMEDKPDAYDFEVKLRDLDLAPLAPFYERSLPVTFERGLLTLESDSVMKTESLISKNKLKLEEPQLAAKKKWGFLGGADEAILQILNMRPSFDLEFEIGGTPDKPSFSGFQTALMDSVKEDLKKLGTQGLQEKAKESLSGAAEKLKSLF